MERDRLLKLWNECKYVDLESEMSNAALIKCSGDLMEIVSDASKKVIEGFSEEGGLPAELIEPFTDGEKCCPEGQDLIDGKCKQVCINCKYNNCRKHSENIGQVFDYQKTKEHTDKKINDDILEYIISEIDV